ncbi:MAG: DUF188 domain-containing protein [Bacilli bacterium]|nr:DUF188 domain-containing protein [Bacilli bacterium]
MKVRLDADAFPDIPKIIETAKTKSIETFLYCDREHRLEEKYDNVILSDTGYQSTDIKLMNQIEPFDIVLTQDYGVATVALSKQAYVLHPKGMIYTKDNIDFMLLERHVNAKMRKQSHQKGPKKRTQEDTKKLLENLLYLINKSLIGKADHK